MHIVGSLQSKSLDYQTYLCSYWHDYQGSTTVEYKIEAQDDYEAEYWFEDMLMRQCFLPDCVLTSNTSGAWDLGISSEEMTPEEVLLWDRRENELAMEMTKQPELFSRDQYLSKPSGEIVLRRLK